MLPLGWRWVFIMLRSLRLSGNSILSSVLLSVWRGRCEVLVHVYRCVLGEGNVKWMQPPGETVLYGLSISESHLHTFHALHSSVHSKLGWSYRCIQKSGFSYEVSKSCNWILSKSQGHWQFSYVQSHSYEIVTAADVAPYMEVTTTSCYTLKGVGSRALTALQEM